MKRTFYRPDQRLALAHIEAMRRRMQLTQQDLADAADISVRTYRRMVASGRGFQRHVRALRFALRTVAAKRRAAARMFTGGDEHGD